MKKRVLSIFTAVVLALTMLTACGTKTDDSMVGTWVCEMDFASYLNEGLATEPEVAEYLSVDSFVLYIELTLNADGTYKMTADTTDSYKSYQAVKEALAEDMTEYLTDAATEYGMSLDEVLDAAGTTVDELLDETFGDEVYQSIIGELDAEGKYEAADGKLYMSTSLTTDIDKDDYETYTLSGNTLTITGDSDGTTDGMYPMVFKK